MTKGHGTLKWQKGHKEKKAEKAGQGLANQPFHPHSPSACSLIHPLMLLQVSALIGVLLRSSWSWVRHCTPVLPAASVESSLSPGCLHHSPLLCTDAGFYPGQAALINEVICLCQLQLEMSMADEPCGRFLPVQPILHLAA